MVGQVVTVVPQDRRAKRSVQPRTGLPAVSVRAHELAQTGTRAPTIQLLRELQQSAGNAAVVRFVKQNAVSTTNISRQTAASTIDADAQKVWDEHKATLKPHYPSAQRFNDDTSEEWGHGWANVHFDRQIENYRAIVPAYIKQWGISNVAQWIHNNIKDAQFFGDSLTAHKDVVPKLAVAEMMIRLMSFGADVEIDVNGGFVPRTIAGSSKLSDHSLGRAVDLNASKNPKLAQSVGFKPLDVSLFRVIKAVTGKDLLVLTDYSSQREASLEFQDKFSDDWIEEQRKELKDDAAALKAAPTDNDLKEKHKAQEALVKDIDAKGGTLSVKAALRRLDRTGFLNLQSAVVHGMQAAGFTWGGTWAKSKDYMHFEVP